MGGIGNTTLAQKLYHDPLVVSHFDTRAWITISQDYKVRAILLGLLGCITGKLTDEVLEKKDYELNDILYKSLYGRRYLIVLDDIWSVNAWNDTKRCFPTNSDRSRIILTTRELDVASYAESEGLQHQMHPLNKSESWNLLRQKVFGEEDCPAALERIGKNIAGFCGGLPLAIHVLGGILSKAKRREDFWEHVANDVRTAIAENDEQFSNILSLSYNHLPNHLKPCFLYMGAFPEDYEIRASKVIRLWVAEGFLKSNGDKSLEEKAEECLKALVERNLLSIRQWESKGKPKSYGIHDLLRDLSLRIAGRERFLHVKNRQVHNILANSSSGLRRLSVHPSYRIRDVYASVEFMSLARSFLCIGLASREILSPLVFASRLLRVLDIFDIKFDQFPTEILHLVNLRYLALFCNSDLPSDEMSRLWNLQTLIVRFRSFRSSHLKIWMFPELRHLKIKEAYVYISYTDRRKLNLEKLQTLSLAYIYDDYDTAFLQWIPNIKNLGLRCYSIQSSVIDLSHLHKLEKLNFLSDLSEKASTLLSRLRFPPPLRKLTLSRCIIPWKFTTTLVSLSNLEVLKIRGCVFEGEETQAKDEEWDATEGEFCSLQFLLLERLNLVHWRADQTNFPRLRHLVIRQCSALEEVPCGIGEIPTLEIIELDKCSASVVASAKHIQEEQRELGNDDLEVRIF